MTDRLPSLKPVELVKALEKAGFKIVRTTGSHAIMWKEGLPRPIPVPIHPKELKRTLQNKIIKEAGLTPEQFAAFL